MSRILNKQSSNLTSKLSNASPLDLST